MRPLSDAHCTNLFGTYSISIKCGTAIFMAPNAAIQVSPCRAAGGLLSTTHQYEAAAPCLCACEGPDALCRL